MFALEEEAAKKKKATITKNSATFDSGSALASTKKNKETEMINLAANQANLAFRKD